MRFVTAFILSVFVLLPLTVYAAEQSPKSPVELSKSVRIQRADKLDKMAEMHKKMAECLRSDKTMSECHEQTIKECPMAKEGHCPMMDEPGMGWGRKHHRGKMMNNDENAPSKKD